MTLQKNQVVAQSASPKQTYSPFSISDILRDDRKQPQLPKESHMEVEELGSPLTVSSESDDDQRSDSSVQSTESKSEHLRATLHSCVRGVSVFTWECIHTNKCVAAVYS